MNAVINDKKNEHSYLTRKPQILLLTGVAGAGKTTVGREISRRLSWSFVDADNFHTPENEQQLAAGKRLSSRDRSSWIRRLRSAITMLIENGTPGVIAFPGLRRTDRAQLTHGIAHIFHVHMRAPLHVLTLRVKDREHRFFNELLLPSEFAALEPPENALTIDASLPISQIVQEIVTAITSSDSEGSPTTTTSSKGR